jgi:NADH:ubiquinone oxidoreductase subunit 5 (subunit L)/multisubunit Na+/H+ antiporter MnhA subunit
MGGLWSRMPLTAMLWFSAALILSALPPTGGFVGKWMLFAGAFEALPGESLGVAVDYHGNFVDAVDPCLYLFNGHTYFFRP